MMIKHFYLSCALVGLFLTGCIHRPLENDYDIDAEIFVPEKNVSVIFVPANMRMPPHLLVKKTVKYFLQNSRGDLPFKHEIILSPLMNEASLKADILRNGKVVRSYDSQRIAQTIVNQKQRVWTPGRSKLSLIIPFLKPDEELLVTTTYSWMDIRWHDPILFEEDEPTKKAEVTIDVPFGVRTHFQMTKDGKEIHVMPGTLDHSNQLWGQNDNKAGLGTRFLFNHVFAHPQSQLAAQRMQLFFSFEPPTENERTPAFDNWERVATYLYDRIDRYDFPSNDIRDFTTKECEKLPDDEAKAVRIFSFVNRDIEKRAAQGSFLDQDVQPATKTFIKRFGSSFDIALLAKAMLRSIGLDAELLAVSNTEINPELTSIYSPALFYSVAVAVTINGRTYYFDPDEPFENLTFMPAKLYGAKLLTLRKSKAKLYNFPKKAVPVVAPLPPEATEAPLEPQALPQEQEAKPLPPETAPEQPAPTQEPQQAPVSEKESAPEPAALAAPIEAPSEPLLPAEALAPSVDPASQAEKLENTQLEQLFEDKASLELPKPTPHEELNAPKTTSEPQNL